MCVRAEEIVTCPGYDALAHFAACSDAAKSKPGESKGANSFQLNGGSIVHALAKEVCVVFDAAQKKQIVGCGIQIAGSDPKASMFNVQHRTQHHVFCLLMGTIWLTARHSSLSKWRTSEQEAEPKSRLDDISLSVILQDGALSPPVKESRNSVRELRDSRKSHSMMRAKQCRVSPRTESFMGQQQ
jgi:hypothetical protein